MLDLTGKNALITGIANNRSIAWGIAQQLHKAGANLGITYLPDDRGRMEKKVAELVEPLQPTLFVPCNVQNQEQIQSTFDAIRDDRFYIYSHPGALGNVQHRMEEIIQQKNPGDPYAAAPHIRDMLREKLKG